MTNEEFRSKLQNGEQGSGEENEKTIGDFWQRIKNGEPGFLKMGSEFKWIKPAHYMNLELEFWQKKNTKGRYEHIKQV